MSLPGALPMDEGEHRFHLLRERAVWWPAMRTLLAADLHLGKGASFRVQGLPVPEGGSAATLAALSALVRRLKAERLIVLGDLWHHSAGLTPVLSERVDAWLKRHAGLAVVLVSGNHDRPLADLSSRLGLPLEAAPWPLSPGLLACHTPFYPLDAPGVDGGPADQAAFYFAGHVHPAVVLRGRGRERLRLPAFVWRPGQLVLPAFGDFVGQASLNLRHNAAPALRFAAIGPRSVEWIE